MKDPVIVDMQRQAEAFEEFYPGGTGDILDPLIIVVAEKNPVQHIQKSFSFCSGGSSL